MKYPNLAQVLTILSALMVSALASNAVQAASYIRCSREAEVRATNPEPAAPKDGCSGTFVVQGLSYRCTTRAEVDTLREQFLKEIGLQGEKACKEACAERSPSHGKCVGVFTLPTRCGFTIPTESAEIYGRDNASCDPRCGGVAFAYCSIYHSVTLQIRPERLKRSSPNCFCKITD